MIYLEINSFENTEFSISLELLFFYFLRTELNKKKIHFPVIHV